MANISAAISGEPSVLSVFQFETPTEGIRRLNNWTQDLSGSVLDFYYLASGQGIGLLYHSPKEAQVLKAKVGENSEFYQCSLENSQRVVESYFFLYPAAPESSSLIFIEEVNFLKFTRFLDEVFDIPGIHLLDLKTPRSLNMLKVQAVLTTSSDDIVQSVSKLASKHQVNFDSVALTSTAARKYLF